MAQTSSTWRERDEKLAFGIEMGFSNEMRQKDRNLLYGIGIHY